MFETSLNLLTAWLHKSLRFIAHLPFLFLYSFRLFREIKSSYHTCMLYICSSTSFMDMSPRNTAATVRYLPCRGSHAAIMFLLSNICWASSATVIARYCCEPRLLSGAKPGMKKCRRGKGTILTANFRKSAFSWRMIMNKNGDYYEYDDSDKILKTLGHWFELGRLLSLLCLKL